MISLQQISYRELENGYYKRYNDRFGIASFVNENIKATFLKSPNNDSIDKTALLYAINDEDIVGRSIIYGTSIKRNNQTIKAQSFGSIEVDESQRGKGIGTLISEFSLNNNEYPFFICSLLSPACHSIMKKKTDNFTLFDFPEYVKVLNTESAFECRGIKGFPLRVLKNLGNIVMHICNIPNKIKVAKLKKSFYVKKESIIPQWAGEMCLNDGHKYAELHDTQWLQWNLDNNLSGLHRDIQSFYAIYNSVNTPVGFFMTKERLRQDIKTCKMIVGTICEWATVDKNLSESDINLLALGTFSRDCYRVLTITDSAQTERELRHMGFVKHGYMQMGIKDKLQQFPDINNMKLWRIRFGCCNSILY